MKLDRNPYEYLPEHLLKNTTNLEIFSAMICDKVRTLPELFFRGLGKLREIQFLGNPALGKEDPLPDGLFEGLFVLEKLSLYGAPFRNLPSLADLPVRTCRSWQTVCMCCTA